MWEGQHFSLEKLKKKILRILVWEGQHFFLREIKTYFSKGFGMGGSDFFP